MQQKSPFFSILVPSYNQAKYLSSALDSLLSQSITDWEALIVNDGSTDNTQQVIDAYCLRDSRFRAFHKSNGGAGSALNVGLHAALGQWICWLSSDDLFEVYKLQTHFDWIEKNPDCMFFFTHFRELDEATGKLKDSEHWRSLPEKRFQVIEMLRGNYIAGNSVCINRIVWERVGVFDESLRYGQDYDMWLRLLAVYPATYIPVRTCITRIHPQQDTHRFPKAPFYDSAKAAIKFLNLHTLVEMFPLMDFNDSRTAWEAIENALSVAQHKRAFIYFLGPNPILINRIMEWVWSNPSLVGVGIQWRIYCRWMIFKYLTLNQEFQFLWRLAAAIAGSSLSFQFNAIEAEDIAEATVRRISALSGECFEQITLVSWLEQSQGRHLDSLNKRHEIKGVNIIIFAQPNLLETMTQGALDGSGAFELGRQLQGFGHNVLIISYHAQGRAKMAWQSGLYIMELKNASDFDELLFNLGLFDIAVFFEERLSEVRFPAYQFVATLPNSSINAYTKAHHIVNLKPPRLEWARVKIGRFLYDCKVLMCLFWQFPYARIFLFELGCQVFRESVGGAYIKWVRRFFRVISCYFVGKSLKAMLAK